MFNASSPSLADIAAVTGNNNNDGGFGGNNGWWVLIILFALFGGWGRGYGNGGDNSSSGNGGNTVFYPAPNYSFGGFGGSSGVASVSAEIQRGFDTSSILSKLDGNTQGICDLGYNQLAQIQTVSNLIQGLSTQTMQSGWNISQSIGNAENNIIRTVDNCCCEQRLATQRNEMNANKNTCEIVTAIKDATTTIVQNDNANYRQLHDELINAQLKAKDDIIAKQEATIQMMNLKGSQNEQTTQLYERMNAIVNSFDAKINNMMAILHPQAGPAWIVPNPNAANNCCQPVTCCN